jgi:hypothetical protein
VREEVAQTMYTHVSKLKKEKKNTPIITEELSLKFYLE